MKLVKINVKKLNDAIPDESLIHALNQRNEPTWVLIGELRNEDDPIVGIEIAFRKCVRVGALRK